MYSEVLYTPHARRAEYGLVRSPLLETIDFMQIQERVEQAGVVGSALEQSFIEAGELAQAVHHSLVFRPNSDGKYDFTAEDIASDQATNCHGHTVVLSELLCRAQINHVIAHANGHSFVVISNFADKTYMVDATSPYFNGNISMAMNKVDLQNVPQQIASFGYGAVRLRTDKVVDGNPSIATDIDALTTKHRWLSKGKRVMLGSGHGNTVYVGAKKRKFVQDHTIVTTLYDPRVGTEAIARHERFRHASAAGQKANAYKHLLAIAGLYPELDSSTPKKEAEEFILDLAKKGYIALAVSAIESIAATYRAEISTDVRLLTWRGDILRAIGRIGSDTALLDSAIKSYAEVPGADESAHVQGKIQKARRIRSIIDQ